MVKQLSIIGLLPLLLLSILSSKVVASSPQHLDDANIDPNDKSSLQRGAKLFVDYCFSCHSLHFMRYNRIAKDLQMSEEEVSKNFIFTGAKVGDPLENAMRPDDAKRWFGAIPPDLSVVSRSRSVDWLYTYLRSFYRDTNRPRGVNNAVFKDVAMPHVLWELQGLQVQVFETGTDEAGKKINIAKGFRLIESGKLNVEQFDNSVRDIVNFLHYVGEPTKATRLSLGKWVIGFLAIYFVVIFLLKKEYWKDIQKN